MANSSVFASLNAGKILAYTQRYADKFYEGRDQADPEAIDIAFQKYFASLGLTQTAQKMMARAAMPRTQALIERDKAMQQGAQGVDTFGKSIEDTYPQKVKEFDKALETLKITIGDKLLPLLTPLIEGITKFVTEISSFGAANPGITTLGILTTVVGGLALAIK